MPLDADTSSGEQSAKAFQDGINNAPPVYQEVWADMNPAYVAVSDFVQWANSQRIVIPVSTTQGYAGGGLVQSFASGGHVRGAGTATSDSIPARLSNGEYVIKKSAVDNIGISALHAINNMKGFASGGSASGVNTEDMKDLGRLTLSVGSSDFQVLAPRAVAEALTKWIETDSGL